MRYSGGWVRLPRRWRVIFPKVIDHQIMTWILENASFEETQICDKGVWVKVPVGSVVTSLKELSEISDRGRTAVHESLKRLERSAAIVRTKSVTGLLLQIGEINSLLEDFKNTPNEVRTKPERNPTKAVPIIRKKNKEGELINPPLSPLDRGDDISDGDVSSPLSLSKREQRRWVKSQAVHLRDKLQLFVQKYQRDRERVLAELKKDEDEIAMEAILSKWHSWGQFAAEMGKALDNNQLQFFMSHLTKTIEVYLEEGLPTCPSTSEPDPPHSPPR